MTTEQMKAAFGDGVILKDFAGTDPTYDGDDCTAIDVIFEDATAIEANHPYVIKVSSKVTSFNVDNVDIDPDQDGAYVEIDNGKTGSRRVVYGGFYGTYKADTEVGENCLFLSGNKFWYSTGATKMLAYRAFFDFNDILSIVDGVRVIGLDDDDTTNINNALRNSMEDGKYYNLKGQRVEKPGKGIYILNGKKVVVK